VKERIITNAIDQNNLAILRSIAHRVMLERDLLPDYSSTALTELGQLISGVGDKVTIS
jgi:hypothetical protein